jgi:hypothetical protein
MLLDVVKILDKKNPEKLKELANKSFSFSTTKKKHPHLNEDGSGMRLPWRVTDVVYMEANMSAWSCIRFIDSLLNEFGFDKNQFLFNVVAEEPSEIAEDEDE